MQATTLTELGKWPALTSIAGPPAHRLFGSTERLFGATAPLVRLWHDSAGWCPFCAQVWMLLEEMRIPYAMKTIPLTDYMTPGQTKPAEYLKICPDGLVPAIQLATVGTPEGSTEVCFGPALSSGRKPGLGSGFEIFFELERLFPGYALLPRTPNRRAYADFLLSAAAKLEIIVFSIIMCGKDVSEEKYIAVMNLFQEALTGGCFINDGSKFSSEGSDREGYVGLRTEFNDSPWSTPIVDDPPVYSSSGKRSVLPFDQGTDDGDGDPATFGGALDAGPFIFGIRPCAIDILLLPMLERADAILPHVLLGGHLHLRLERWPDLKKMLVAAQAPGFCAYGEIANDPETLVGIILRRTPDILPVQSNDIEVIAGEAAALPETACRDAAARLCTNHSAVARFSCRGRGAGRTDPDRKPLVDPNGKASQEDVISSTDDSLRAVTTLLLLSPRSAQALRSAAVDAAMAIRFMHGQEAAHVAGSALQFLSGNVGVPRDMGFAPAAALRLHAVLLSVHLSTPSQFSVHQQGYSLLV